MSGGPSHQGEVPGHNISGTHEPSHISGRHAVPSGTGRIHRLPVRRSLKGERPAELSMQAPNNVPEDDVHLRSATDNAGLPHILLRRPARPLIGGEDYELLFTVPSGDRKRFESQARRARHRFTCIGVIRPHSFGLRVRTLDATLRQLTAKSYEHFRPHPIHRESRP